MNSKKAKLLLGVAIVGSVFAAYSFGYHRGYAARGPMVMLDSDLIQNMPRPALQAHYDAYFTSVNTVPERTK
jgi:hypothetical protein